MNHKLKRQSSISGSIINHIRGRNPLEVRDDITPDVRRFYGGGGCPDVCGGPANPEKSHAEIAAAASNTARISHKAL